MVLLRRLFPSLSRAPLHLSTTGKGFRINEEKACEEEDDDSEESDKAKDETKEQKAEEGGQEEEKEVEEEEEQQEEEEKQEQKNKEDETERQESRPAPETQSPPLPHLRVLSGADPDLGPQLREAAASGKNWSLPIKFPFCPPLTQFSVPTFAPGTNLLKSPEGTLLSASRELRRVRFYAWGGRGYMLVWSVGCLCLPPTGHPMLLTNMELGLGCPELQWLLQREQLSPPQVQSGFCLYLSTTLPLSALEKGEAQWVSCQHSSALWTHLGLQTHSAWPRAGSGL